MNYLIRTLLEKGAVKATNIRTSNSKIAYVYLLTPAGFAHKAAHAKGYLQRKLAEYEALCAEIERLRQEPEPVAPERMMDSAEPLAAGRAGASACGASA